MITEAVEVLRRNQRYEIEWDPLTYCWLAWPLPDDLKPVHLVGVATRINVLPPHDDLADVTEEW